MKYADIKAQVAPIRWSVLRWVMYTQKRPTTTARILRAENVEVVVNSELIRELISFAMLENKDFKEYADMFAPTKEGEEEKAGEYRFITASLDLHKAVTGTCEFYGIDYETGLPAQILIDSVKIMKELNPDHSWHMGDDE